LLIENLPSRVGSPLSIQNLRENLSVSHDSVSRWLKILETLYVVFRISPFGSPKIKAVTKEQKLYLWDWSQNENEGARFENMVASHLLKYCNFIEDTEGHSMELRYLRDKDKREIDFVVLKDKRPVFAVEAKVSGKNEPAPEAAYFRARTGIPKFYQVHLGIEDFGNEDTSIRILPFWTFCRELQIP
jgi:predicted AAA+ superfamily ATPase